MSFEALGRQFSNPGMPSTAGIPAPPAAGGGGATGNPAGAPRSENTAAGAGDTIGSGSSQPGHSGGQAGAVDNAALVKALTSFLAMIESGDEPSSGNSKKK